MAKTYTVTEYNGEYNDWPGNANMGPLRYFKFKFRDSEGGVGDGSFGRQIKNGQPPEPPQPGFEFVADATFDAQHQNWKFKKVQTPEQHAQYGDRSAPVASGGSHDDKMRSKEQCMRGEAVQAAASAYNVGPDVTAAQQTAILSLAEIFYRWIEGPTAELPTTSPYSPTPESVTPQWSDQAPPVLDNAEVPF